MKYYRHPETGEVFAYEDDGSQDDYIDSRLVRMTGQEVAEHLKPFYDPAAVEAAWRDDEMNLVADQLLRIEDEDPSALPGTGRQWRDYRIHLRAWVEGSQYYPDSAYRPARPN